VPAKFEAGTGHLAGAVGFGVALEYLERLGRQQLAVHEQKLTNYAIMRLRSVPGLHVLGDPLVRVAALPFVLDGHTPEAVAKHLDRDGIAVRAGHHCAQPILRRFGLTAAVRPSLGVYNTEQDVEALVESLGRLVSGATR
jgi:cysteine desulfurase/selenocysteine lyase